MYGYALLYNKFRKLGRIHIIDKDSGTKCVLAFPLNPDPDDPYRISRGSKYWRMSPNEGEVYDCKTVWLSHDDVNLAKKLITEALKGRRDIKIKEAKAKYQKAINALNRIDF